MERTQIPVIRMSYESAKAPFLAAIALLPFPVGRSFGGMVLPD